MERDDYYPYKPGTSAEDEVMPETTCSEEIVEVIKVKPPKEESSLGYILLLAVTGPFFMPAVAMLLIFTLSILSITARELTLPYTLMVYGATGLLPFLLLAVLKTIRAISSITLETKKDRRGIYIIEIVALAAVSLFLKYKHAPEWMWYVFSGAAVCAFVNFLINFKFKISCQAASLGALLAVIMIINGDGMPHDSLVWWAVGIVLLAGITGSLSIYYRRHTVWEVLAGYATGFLCIFLSSLCAQSQAIVI